MKPPPTFEQVCGEFRQFRAIMDRSFVKLGEGPVKQQVRELARLLDSKFAEFQETYPKTMADLDGKLAHAEQQAKQTQLDMAELKAKLAESQHAAPADAPSAPKAPPPLDPMLGPSLRNELLAQFGGPKKPEEPKGRREVWEDWDGWEHKL